VHGRDLPAAGKVSLALVLLLLSAGPALAYVGPGAGLELVGYSVSLLAWVLAAFSAVLLYPIYALLRRVRGRKVGTSTPFGVANAAEEEARSATDTGR
jgi:hypothetical protein